MASEIWRPSTNDELQTDLVYLTSLEEDTFSAKEKELLSWKSEGVYQEVENTGQKTISTRWVLKPKVIDGIQSVKARLCARGFEEDKNFRTDSPTCSREGVRVALSTLACYKWDLKSLDIKSAFLQGKKMERTVFLKPPKEASTNKIWLLQKCVYGLSDASRFWYLRVREEIIKLDGEVSALDQGLFLFFENNELQGIISCFVDDMVYGGNIEFENNVIKPLRQTFTISSENRQSFYYVGINIHQNPDKSIVVNQTSYIKSIISIPLTKHRNPDDELSSEETTEFRGVVGQLNWVSGITRPDISFEVCNASTKCASPTIRDVIRLNKVIRQLKNDNCQLFFPSMDPLQVKLTVYTDASFNNLPKGGSQGGQIIFLSDFNQNCSPIAWNSSRIKRVVRSTLAAETLSLADGYGTASYLQHLLARIFPSVNSQSTTAITDSKSLYETVNTSHRATDKSLVVNIGYLRQWIDDNKLYIVWKEGH